MLDATVEKGTTEAIRMGHIDYPYLDYPWTAASVGECFSLCPRNPS